MSTDEKKKLEHIIIRVDSRSEKGFKFKIKQSSHPVKIEKRSPP